MEPKDRGRTGRFVLALVLGSILGVFAGTLVQQRIAAPDADETARAGGPLSSQDRAELEQGVAWRYARAMQAQDWDFVIAHTLWMQERLARAAERGEDADAAYAALIALLSERLPEGNQLRYEGIEDQYVFSPASELEVVGVDAGRADLERPASARVWIEVTYPERRWAVLDPSHLAIRTLHAGVNVTADGFVLKANVIGNLDIRWNSIGYDWPVTKGD